MSSTVIPKLAAIAAFFATVLIGPHIPAQPAQSQVPQWQIDAGGKMSFDVASVKQNKSGPTGTVYSNILINAYDSYTATGGLLSVTNFQLRTYIRFAYKLTAYQTHVLQLPNWAGADRFDIEARAPMSNPTKDQMRLMMQSLLSDRFKLAAHYETRQVPVFALRLENAGKTGPQLKRRPDALPCVDNSATPDSGLPSQRAKESDLPPSCDTFTGLNLPGRLRGVGQHLTMRQIADFLPFTSSSIDRPVVDQTGLAGWFDFSIDFAPEFDGPPPPQFQPDPEAVTFLVALKEQLGLKLVPSTGPVDVLVVDHVEEPSPN